MRSSISSCAVTSCSPTTRNRSSVAYSRKWLAVSCRVADSSSATTRPCPKARRASLAGIQAGACTVAATKSAQRRRGVRDGAGVPPQGPTRWIADSRRSLCSGSAGTCRARNACPGGRCVAGAGSRAGGREVAGEVPEGQLGICAQVVGFPCHSLRASHGTHFAKQPVAGHEPGFERKLICRGRFRSCSMS